MKRNDYTLKDYIDLEVWLLEQYAIKFMNQINEELFKEDYKMKLFKKPKTK